MRLLLHISQVTYARDFGVKYISKHRRVTVLVDDGRACGEREMVLGGLVWSLEVVGLMPLDRHVGTG